LIDKANIEIRRAKELLLNAELLFDGNAFKVCKVQFRGYNRSP
jgi:hypothetical protein